MNNSTLCTSKFEGHSQRSPGSGREAPAPLSRRLVPAGRPPRPPRPGRDRPATATFTVFELTTRISKEKLSNRRQPDRVIKRHRILFECRRLESTAFVVLLSLHEACQCSPSPPMR
ncbi:hypothetical protein EVAR_44854_1 [Eumeta japonica]|uniref:Uncharacterized protein n=1 Tax=Eumeta variegata TaxID=151549 RepID=A0A4C1YME7_EUMVA|nr:hypothetical protein EVAR_44854_1 [Eumeta japonica]